MLNTIRRLVEPTLTVLSHLTSYHSLTFRFETWFVFLHFSLIPGHFE